MTESLKKTKLQLNKAPSVEAGKLDGHVEAYKSDNAKLVKENNDLHQQLIKQKETADFTSKGMLNVEWKMKKQNRRK